MLKGQVEESEFRMMGRHVQGGIEGGKSVDLICKGIQGSNNQGLDSEWSISEKQLNWGMPVDY